jgi:hypothetical protein
MPKEKKQFGISDSPLCISLLSKILVFESWLHWKLTSALKQVVLFDLVHFFSIFLGNLMWYKLVHHCLR